MDGDHFPAGWFDNYGNPIWGYRHADGRFEVNPVAFGFLADKARAGFGQMAEALTKAKWPERPW